MSNGSAWQGQQQHLSMMMHSRPGEGDSGLDPHPWASQTGALINSLCIGLPQMSMAPRTNGNPRTEAYQMPFPGFSRNPVQMHLAQQSMIRDLQLQAHIASLPLATPLKGSPTGTPASGRQFALRTGGPAHQQTESAILANMHSLYSTSPSGNATPATAQNQIMGFANHAQLLRAKLSPLVTPENGGLSRAMDQPMSSPCPVPATAAMQIDGEKKAQATRLPFMGHVGNISASSSPPLKLNKL